MAAKIELELNKILKIFFLAFFPFQVLLMTHSGPHSNKGRVELQNGGSCVSVRPMVIEITADKDGA